MNQPRHVHSDLPNAYAEPKSLFSLGWMDLDILSRERRIAGIVEYAFVFVVRMRKERNLSPVNTV